MTSKQKTSSVDTMWFTRCGGGGRGPQHHPPRQRARLQELSSERLELFRQQKTLPLTYGILDRDFDLDAWVDPQPLAEAQRRLAEYRAVA